MTSKPRGYWTDFQNIKRTIIEFITHQEGIPGVMPTETDLRKAGHRSLVVAIHKHHGSLHDVAQRLHLSVTQKSKGHWKDFGNVKREILAFVAERGTPGVMPTATQLRHTGRGGLVAAISAYHGGFQVVAQRLGLTCRLRSKGYWRDFGNIRRAVFAFVAENGNSQLMPTERDLRDAGLSSLSTAIYQYHGSFHEVASQLNLSMRRKPKISRRRVDGPTLDS